MLSLSHSLPHTHTHTLRHLPLTLPCTCKSTLQASGFQDSRQYEVLSLTLTPTPTPHPHLHTMPSPSHAIIYMRMYSTGLWLQDSRQYQVEWRALADYRTRFSDADSYHSARAGASVCVCARGNLRPVWGNGWIRESVLRTYASRLEMHMTSLYTPHIMYSHSPSIIIIIDDTLITSSTTHSSHALHITSLDPVMTDCTENATPRNPTNPGSQISWSKFKWARGGGGALAPQLPCAIRVGPNEGEKKSGPKFLEFIQICAQILISRIDKLPDFSPLRG